MRIKLHIALLRTLPLILLAFLGLTLQAQEVCTDTIYASKAKKTITDCCIERVENDNLVIYHKNGQRFAIEAYAIVKSGVYIPLRELAKEPIQPPNTEPVRPPQQTYTKYSGSYEYYQKRYRRARIFQGLGGFVSITGLAMFIGAIVSVNNGNITSDRAETLAITGFFGFHIGMPFFIAGSIASRNSKKAMVAAKKNSLNLSMGVTPNGVGLVLKF